VARKLPTGIDVNTKRINVRQTGWLVSRKDSGKRKRSGRAMNISDKTMAAVEKAAAKEKMSVDNWADRALARAAALGKKSNVESLLGDISRKLDDIAERQSFGEKANEQLAAAVSDLGTSFEQIKKRTGRVFDQMRSRTGSTVSDIAEKARDVIGQVSRSATELAGSLAQKTGGDAEKAGGETQKTDGKTEKAATAKEAAKPRQRGSAKKPRARSSKKTTARRRTPTSR
jgi:hypothetical protein